MARSPHAIASLNAFRTALRLAGHSATYYRGESSIAVCVLPGRQDQLNRGRADVAVSGAFANFEIEAATLTLDGDPITPDKGDRLVVDFDGTEKEFQAALGPNNRVWDWADNHHQILTCHYAGRPAA